MKEKLIEGNYATAKVFTVDDDKIAIDQHAEAQIKMICDNKVSENASIRVMPDVHAGKVGPIGLTMAFDNERIIPNLIGPDIGCGISVYRFFPKHKLTRSDFEKLDSVIRENIPSGDKKRKSPPESMSIYAIRDTLKAPIDAYSVFSSFGTLGGGNHFIEIGTVEKEHGMPEYYLTIHSGSRSLGPVVNKFYNDMGQKSLKVRKEEVPYEMTYIEGDLFKDYIMDCSLCNVFSSASRDLMAFMITTKMKFDSMYLVYDTNHNTIVKTQSNLFKHKYLLTKGANDASDKLDQIPIPINMKEGIVVVSPKLNADWNYCLPHGSGRLIKRTEVKNVTTVSAFKKDMEGIYSTSIRPDTLDESSIAYRKMDDILPVLKEVADVVDIIKPVYSFKAGGKE